jgi:hypothetical protein
MRITGVLVATVGLVCCLTTPTSIGQPVYSDPPCLDPGSNCNFTLTKDREGPANRADCPDCVAEMRRFSYICATTPGTGDTQFCGYESLPSFQRYIRTYDCIGVAMNYHCDYKNPLTPKQLISIWDTVLVYTNTSPCPSGDCIDEN